ncbi:MAG: X-X-X-Leu-X-X-Gly heptad, partial [Bacilli bacterium]|nr:X-X-X-Leu-X-X-Gly heptad [Bacilli bacterium]
MKNKTLNKITAWALIAGLTMQAAPVWALSKDETIYAKLNSDGSTNSVIVSEHISDNGNTNIKDKSNLNDIKNVSGDEVFKNNNGEIVWETNGKDVYYQGTTENEMPVSVNIKYYLNGEEKQLYEMIGKSG